MPSLMPMCMNGKNISNYMVNNIRRCDLIFNHIKSFADQKFLITSLKNFPFGINL